MWLGGLAVANSSFQTPTGATHLLKQGVAPGEIVHLLLLVPHGFLGEAYPLPEGLLLFLQHLPDPLLGLPRPPLPQQLELLLRGQLVLEGAWKRKTNELSVVDSSGRESIDRGFVRQQSLKLGLLR